MKTILIIIGILVVLGVGGYFAYTSMNTENPSQQNQPADQVQAQEVTIGTGREAKPGDTVSVLYVGQFTDGRVFDSSEAHGNTPLTFVLGAPGMIPGFQIGVNGMKEGGERLMSIPPTLGYGEQAVTDQATGQVVIPANSTLVFRVKLVSVTPATSSPTQ